MAEGSPPRFAPGFLVSLAAIPRKKSASEHHFQGILAEHRPFSRRSVFPEATYLARNSLHQQVVVRDSGEPPLEGATWASVTHFPALPHAGPPILHTSQLCSGPAGPRRLWSRGKGNLCPGPAREGAWWGSSGKGERTGGEPVTTDLGERDVTHLRDLFAILRVPHRRGLGGDAGQPPPASGECFRAPTLPPTARLPLPGHRARNARPRRGRTKGRTDTRPPGPQRRSYPRPGPVRDAPNMSAGALPPSAGPSRRLSASSPQAPTPARSPQQAALQGSQEPPAGFCPLRRISRPASLQSRRLNLRTRPRTSLAGAAAREDGGRGAESARGGGRGRGAGSRAWNSRESGRSREPTGGGRGSRALR